MDPAVSTPPLSEVQPLPLELTAAGVLLGILLSVTDTLGLLARGCFSIGCFVVSTCQYTMNKQKVL